jgi:hypothetical protein
MDAVRLHLILAHGATAALVLAGLGGLRYGLRPRLAVQQLLDELALLGTLAGLAAWFIGPYALELVGLGLEAPAAARAEAHEDTARDLPWLLIPLLGLLLGLRFGGSRWQPFRPLAWFLHLLAATGLVYVAALGGAIRHS